MACKVLIGLAQSGHYQEMVTLANGLALGGMALIAGAVVVIHVSLEREHRRLRIENRMLGGTLAGRSSRSETGIVWAVMVGALAPCAILLTLSPSGASAKPSLNAPLRAGIPPLLVDSRASFGKPKPSDAPAAGDCRSLPPSQLGRYLESVAQKEGLPTDLLSAIIYSESRFRPCAVSESGAVGMMQLMPATAAELGVRNAEDPAENIAAGARLLRRLLGRYDGDLTLALAAYHAGPGRVDAYRGVPPFPATQAYVAKVLWVLGENPSLSRPAD